MINKVVDAVIDHRPEWVISACRKQAEGLIARTQSRYYPIAARWLAKMKAAYVQLGREEEWQAYLENLRAAYPRHRALLAQLRWL